MQINQHVNQPGDFSKALASVRYQPHNKNPWETGLDRFAKDLKAALRRDALILTAQEVAALAISFEAQLDCYWGCGPMRFSRDVFFVTFVEKKTYTGELQFNGCFRYDCDANLEHQLRSYQIDRATLDLDGLYQANFQGYASGAWSCVFNDRSLKERLSAGSLTLVPAEKLPAVIDHRQRKFSQAA